MVSRMWPGEETGGVEDSGGGRRFLIRAGPLLHFLEHDAVFCGGNVRLVENRERKKHSR